MYRLICINIFLATAIFAVPFFARAGDIGPLEIPTIKSLPSFPCVVGEDAGACKPENIKDLGGFFLWLYNFGFWIVGIALFIALIWAGVQYILAGPNIGNIAQAKSMLTNVLLGFILLLSAWLILTTINPDLVQDAFRLSPLSPITVSQPGAAPQAQPPSEVTEEGSGIPKLNGGGGGNGGGGFPPSGVCEAKGLTEIGAARNGSEYCDDLNPNVNGTVTLMCDGAQRGGYIYVAGPPPSTCPVPIAAGGRQIPPGETPRCTNISTFCLGDSQAEFDRGLLGIKQEVECATGNETITVQLSSNDYVGAIGTRFTTVLVCQ